MKIIWSENAVKSFSKILDFLEINWGEKQIQDFYQLTSDTLEQIKNNPFQFKSSNKNDIRKGFIHKNVSLFYRVDKTSETIELLFFFDNRSKSIR
ncbi:type II toxin-antitoxin system RelE/ParE family toxin [Galbibacter sp. EGI 63066]|uniref:type II toxin-antitoxin system RelE/ParE family toxin n=1 Tax=Galbibacter sp. EGI 63066 TaxID=2993559 RepID=UPI0022498326|nr:type II toxin-antitoxin system RelE/ParE family toxin [Galbibacter sp. EGI 63066]MCX2679417.1 type II toxin-antitoxin system RelE/ParE family toxin [Galbibacter sp. EGI 63066]